MDSSWSDLLTLLKSLTELFNISEERTGEDKVKVGVGFNGVRAANWS